uniref:Small auxin-up RNA n=1 Tax=Lactuca sativa TaxID=4236 RepID=A0A9R1WGP4_LACSA|nr:hypothetical protein LSAT_V11C200067770 [Lactuca sativa]
MGIHMPRIIQGRQILQRSLSNGTRTTKRIYRKGILQFMLESMKRSDLLRETEEEFGYAHSMGGLTIPCCEQTFFDIATRLGAF